MQAIMLAAGMGRRMGKYTESCTKCMISIAGKTLLERVVESLKEAGINKLIMVVGYEAERLKQYIEESDFGMEIEYVENPIYSETNNIYSLFLAKEHLVKDDTILLESDLIYESRILKKVMDSKEPNLVVVAKYEQWMDGTVVMLDSQKRILDFVDKNQFRYEDIGKYYKTVNIYKFSKEFSEKQYIPFLEAYLKAYGTNQYYEQVLKILSHISGAQLKAHVLDDENWYEVDDAQDLDIARTIFAEDDILKKYEYHFGGYWRFPKVKDYCYLVNPYYPPQKMMDQMKFFFEDLMTQYPSGMDIQKLNAGSMFDIDDDYLLVGNGAAELIEVLGRKMLSGKLSVGVPTFNEYIRCFEKCEIRLMDNSKNGYQYNLSQILDEIEHTDNLLLINPDNPSGSFLTYKEMIQILEKCKEYNVKCIFDESFIDFASKDIRYTLIKEKILKKYPQLYVIKSVSKSYGVPGIRLGVIATSDKKFLKQMRSNMPIWNINSFAEYYLQIQRLYKRTYLVSCDKIAEQRKHLISELEKIESITVYPSQANYVMCKLEGQYTSGQLARELIKKYNILIKDLSQKKGFGKQSFIRIAVKNEEDNKVLIAAMNELFKSEDA